MSERALELAVRDSIRSTLAIGQALCEVMENGQPPPRCGKVFYAVHGAGVTQSCQNSIDELYAITVTITLRINEPFDSLGTALTDKALVGMHDRIQALKYIHMSPASYAIMNAANTYIKTAAEALASPPAQVYGFCEPLQFLSAELPPEIVGAEWFKAAPEAQMIGIKSAVKFGKARRFQPNSNIQ